MYTFQALTKLSTHIPHPLTQWRINDTIDERVPQHCALRASLILREVISFLLLPPCTLIFLPTPKIP